MRTIILSLMFLASFSFTGNAKESATLAVGDCTNCFNYADGALYADGDWQDAYDHCRGNLTPCSTELKEIVLIG